MILCLLMHLQSGNLAVGDFSADFAVIRTDTCVKLMFLSPVAFKGELIYLIC